MRSPLRSPAQVEGTQGFLPQPEKDLERPSSTRLEATFPYHGSGKLKPEDFLAIRTKLQKAIAVFEEKVIAVAADVQRKIIAAGLGVEDFAHGKSGIAPRLKAYAEGDLEKFGDENKNISKAIASGKFYSGSAGPAAKAAIDELQPEIIAAWTRFEELRENEFGKYQLRKLLLRNIYA